MTVGAYWAMRPESREQSAVRVAQFLVSLSERAELPFTRWLFKGRTRDTARRPLALSPGVVAQALRTQRRDTDRCVIAELGFRLDVWNGESASFETTIGSASPYVRNCAVLTVGDDVLASEREWEDILSLSTMAFDPDHAAVVAEARALESADKAIWELGWIRFEKGVGFFRS